MSGKGSTPRPFDRKKWEESEYWKGHEKRKRERQRKLLTPRQENNIKQP
jgi:hypothetical protein